ncbi:melibiose:sodium transporter MelB [Shewanella sp. OPT22]|nr:melibiose:sodium transporter MelB [Shewanella sp. OPT22]
MTNHSVTLSTKISYGIGALGKDFVWALTNTFLMFYFTDVADISPAFIGAIFLIARVLDAFTDPIMGIIVDNTRSRFGKFRPWILIGTIVNSIFVVGLFLTHEISQEWKYAYAAVMYIMWGLTYTIMDIPFWSMISSLTTSRKQREKLVVWPRLFATIAGALIGTYGLKTVGFFGGDDMGTGFAYLSVICVITFLISSLVTFWKVKPVVEIPLDAEKLNIRDILSVFKLNDQLRIFIGFVAIFGIGNNFIGGFNIYYTTQLLERPDLFANMSLIGAFCGPAGVLLFPHISNWLPRKNIWYVIASTPAVFSVLLFMAYIFEQENIYFLGLASAVVSFGGGLFGALAIVLLGDIIDYGEKASGQRTESIIFSTFTMLTKATGAISAFMVGMGLSFSNYVPDTEISAFTADTFRWMIMLPPLLLMLSSAFIYKRFYQLK